MIATRDWRYVILVAVHELVEMMLTRHRSISVDIISGPSTSTTWITSA